VQLHQPHILEEFARLDARIVAVSFAPLEQLKEWVPYFHNRFLAPHYRAHRLELPESPLSRTRFAADTGLGVYHAYGMGRNSRYHVYGPRIVWQYFRWGLVGKPLKVPRQDTLQRGGDFVVGSDGRLTLCHVGRDQADRPLIADILTALSVGSRTSGAEEESRNRTGGVL
jgi:hypothetical protein